ncbi:porin [Cochlodiniinecator piscidefendens]|uniref:porin n=1 Tax=Cochlodiniinecator piscidefendens TaxID=2715756 RepID=UPI00140879EB|nr:porin [Cochlodiniinecator piscidefendens]
MKKVLFATTALVATAGIAAADVTLSGSAEMGVVGGDGETQFHHDMDVRFTLSGETDNGLTFGATIDLDEVVQTTGGALNADADIPANRGPHAVFISGNFGTVTLGDTDGAFDWAMQEVGVTSSINDAHTTHAGFNFNSGLDGDNDGQVLRYDHTFGDISFALSAELDDSVGGSDNIYGVGVKYNAALGSVDLGLGLAMQQNDARNIFGVSVDANFAGGFRAILNYSDLDGDGGNDNHTGLGLAYSMDALTIAANYGVYDRTVGADRDAWGLGVTYDLGGGAQAQFGYGSDTDGATAGSQELWSLGLAFSF